MTELEQAFIDAFHRVDDLPVPPPAVRLTGVGEGVPAGRRENRAGAGVTRLLAIATGIALVAGVVALALWQPWGAQHMGAVPAETPVRTPVVRTPSPTPTATPGLAGESVWNVVEVAGRPAVTSAKGELPYLEFDTEKQTVRLGGPCPDLKAAYRQDGSSVRFVLGDAAFSCGDREALSRQLERLWIALDQTRAFESRGGVLTLRDDAGEAVLVAHDDLAYAEPLATPTAPAGLVRVAIHNATGRHLDSVLARFPSGEEVDYGPLPAGATSRAAQVGLAFGYTWLEVTSGDDTWTYQPDDYVGESPLSPGAHVYELSLHGGQLDIRAGDPGTPTPRQR